MLFGLLYISRHAIFQHCDVLVFEQLVALFKLAIATYGTINIVVANAGVTEVSQFGTINLVKNPADGELEPKKPDLKTVEVNLISVMHSTASHSKFTDLVT